jgi:hypothetical protein
MATYVDNQVPFGSRTEEIFRAGTSIGTFIFENLSLTRPGKVGERHNQIGEPNGWWVVDGFPHGTGVVQIPTIDSPYPQNGDYFEDTFRTGSTAERWVIVDTTEPYAMNDYYKMNVTIRLSKNPPA